VKIGLESVSRPTWTDCSFGFRPRRSPPDALQVLTDEHLQRGRRWVAETDIADCFTAMHESGPRLDRQVSELLAGRDR
jgi:RNA-directed DNA polymerase